MDLKPLPELKTKNEFRIELNFQDLTASFGSPASPNFTGLTLTGLTASRLLVSDGSKGLASNAALTANGFAYPSAAGALASTAAATNGQILIGSTSAAPVIGAITGTYWVPVRGATPR